MKKGKRTVSSKTKHMKMKGRIRKLADKAKKKDMTKTEMEEYHNYVTESKMMKGAPKWITDELIRDIFDSPM